jgi:inositol phosphorylceramide mannosyltransferase catalytic subunit
MTSSIPKIIHQIWLGPKEPPQWCIDSWRIEYMKSNPDWTYKMWNEEEIEQLGLINKDIYDKESTYRGKSDIARYEILYKEGGIFIDADILWLNSKSLNNVFEELPNNTSTNNILFGASEPTVNSHLVANSLIGCNRNNNIMFNLIHYLKDKYEEKKIKYGKDHQIWLVTGPVPFNEILKPFVDDNSDCLKIFPSYYFAPEKFVNGNIKMTISEIENRFPNSYMYHYWLSHYN